MRKLKWLCYNGTISDAQLPRITNNQKTNHVLFVSATGLGMNKKNQKKKVSCF